MKEMTSRFRTPLLRLRNTKLAKFHSSVWVERKIANRSTVFCIVAYQRPSLQTKGLASAKLERDSESLHTVLYKGQIMHCNENPIYVILFWELRGLGPNFHIHVSLSGLYIPRIGPHISCSRIGRLIVGIYKSLTDT
jgi:hypothetical protein